MSCAIAGGAFLYEYKTSFNEAFSVTTVCVIIYWILQSIGFAYSYFVQKNEIFVGTQKLNGKVNVHLFIENERLICFQKASGVLKISGKIEKYSPNYELEFQYTDKSSGKKAHYKVVPNVTTWFNSTGTLNRDVMDKEIGAYLTTVKEKLHKN